VVLQMVDRRTVLYGLSGLAALAATGVRAGDLPPGFVAIGDWGRDGQMRQTDVAVAMAGAAAELDSRFVISAGDNFYPSGVQSVADPQWRSSFEDVYAARSLQTPWYVALGNHDYRGVPHAQVAYSRVSDRWRMPSRYYTVSGAEVGVPDLQIFFLDTTPLVADFDEKIQQLMHGHRPTHRPGRQVAWLKGALERSKAPWKIVVGHHPIYSGGRHGGSPELVARISPLLEAHGVQAYICGHDHILQHTRMGRTDHICTGAGASAGRAGDVEGTLFSHSEPGFAMFTLDADTLGLEFRDFAGRSLYRAALPRARA